MMILPSLFERSYPGSSHQKVSSNKIDMEAERITASVATALHLQLEQLRSELKPQAEVILKLSQTLIKYNAKLSSIESFHSKIACTLLCTLPVTAATVTGIYVPFSETIKVFSAIGSFLGGSGVGGVFLWGGRALIQSKKFERWFLGSDGIEFEAAANTLFSRIYPSFNPRSDLSFSSDLERIVNVANVVLKKSCLCQECCEDFCDRIITPTFIREGIFNNEASFDEMPPQAQQRLIAFFIKEKLIELSFYENRLAQRWAEICKATQLPLDLVNLSSSFLCENVRVNPTGAFFVKVQNHLRDIYGHEREMMSLEDHDWDRHSRASRAVSLVSVSDAEEAEHRA